MIEARLQGRLGAFTLDLDLSVPASGVTVLFGPSGAGKTTVLRALAGVTRLSGRVAVRGEIWQDGGQFTPPHRRRVGYVFQDAALFDHLSVRDNLLYGRRRAGLTQDQGFDRIVDLLDLRALLARGPEKLSGGERQRVAIGRALLAEPRLLLMDEPVASLDGARKADITAHLAQLSREADLPIIYVTHDVTEAARLGDRLVVIRNGRVTDVTALGAAAGQGDRTWLAERLAAVGAEALTAELVVGGTPPAIAALAVEALGRDRSSGTGRGEGAN